MCLSDSTEVKSCTWWRNIELWLSLERLALGRLHRYENDASLKARKEGSALDVSELCEKALDHLSLGIDSVGSCDERYIAYKSAENSLYNYCDCSTLRSVILQYVIL